MPRCSPLFDVIDNIFVNTVFAEAGDANRRVQRVRSRASDSRLREPGFESCAMG